MPLPVARSCATAWLIIAAAFLVWPHAARAEPRAVLLVVANRISADELNHPAFRDALKDFRISLISPQQTGKPQAGSVFATISAGTPSRGVDEYGLVLNAAEPFEAGTAAQGYARRTAFPEPRGGLVHLGLAQVAAANRKLKIKPQVMLLGDALRKSGVKRTAYGSSDVSPDPLRLRGRSATDVRSRKGAALLCDRWGLVPAGDIGPDTMKTSDSVPGGQCTDLSRLAPAVARSLAGGAVTAVEFGDLERIEQERISCTPEAYALARSEALDRLVSWLRQMHERFPVTPLMLISPVPPLDENGIWDRLGFAAVFSPGSGAGLLTSNTTRTAGIIAAIDVAPTLLHLAGAAPDPALGGYSADADRGAPVQTLRRWDLTVRLKRELGLPVILGLGVFAAASGIAAIWHLVRRKDAKKGAAVVLVGLAFTAWIPALLLIPLDSAWLYFLAAPGVLAGFLLAAKFKERARFAPVEIALLALLIALALCAFGALDWTKRSPLCPWQFGGLRFYGIGNEFMGCIIGSSVIPLWRYGRGSERPPMPALPIWFAFWVLVLGLPMLGANFGGAIASTVAFGLVLRALAERPVRLRDAAVLAGAGVVAALGLAMLDAAVSGQAPTHLGRAVRMMESGEGWYLAAMLQRKASMNLSLWAGPAGALTAVVFGTVVAAWAVYHKQMLAALHLPTRIVQGLVGIGYGALAALLFNDSGIVSVAFIAAVTMLWWLWDAATLRAGGMPAVRRPVARAGS